MLINSARKYFFVLLISRKISLKYNFCLLRSLKTLKALYCQTNFNVVVKFLGTSLTSLHSKSEIKEK